MNLRRQKAFTLIELLIAATLLMALLVMGMFAYQLFDMQWRRNVDKVDQAFQKYRDYDLLSSTIHSIVPYLVNAKSGGGYYFLGDEKGFTAITLSPVVQSSWPAVIRIFAEQDEKGLYRLVYEEASLENTVLIDAEQVLPFDTRRVLATGLKSVSFQYYVLPSLDVDAEFDEAGGMENKKEWLLKHDGLITRTHPEQIVINLAGFPLYAIVGSRETTLNSRAIAEVY